tara:strand:- start:958 stop:1164 length:207 start_codon:yes stop_codon:yes gene_type:complete
MPCEDTLEKRAILYWSASMTWRRNILPTKEEKLLFDVLSYFDWTDKPRWQHRLDELKMEMGHYGPPAA